MLFPADPLQLPDVKLWLFSRRIFGGADTENATRVCRPRAVYAHSSVLKKTDYFHGVLSSGFSESSSSATLGSSFPASRSAYTDCYDYEDDSDLEEDYDAEADETHAQANAPETGPIISLADTVARGTPCKEILLPDIAYVTFRALVFYLYTGKVHFRELRSNSPDQIPEDRFEDQKSVPQCSPKSMYRLAEKLGVEHLQALSLDGIRDSLTPSNILEELFSEFTTLYPEVLKIETQYLCDHYDHPEVASGWQRAFEKLCCGECPHAAGIMACLLKETLAPRPPKPQMYRPPSPEFADCVYGNYIRSLTVS